MSIDPLAKRFYVITTFGEVGPVGIDELQEMLTQGRIRPGDTVRSAFGKPLGTVADALAGRILSARATPGVDLPPPSERRRRTSSGRVPVHGEPMDMDRSRRSPLIWILGGVTVVLVVLVVIAAGGSARPRPTSMAGDDPAQAPVLILAQGGEDEAGVREILVRTTTPLGKDLDVQVEAEGTASGGVRLDPPEGLVTMRAGTSTVAVQVAQVAGDQPRQTQVRLRSRPGYQLGNPAALHLTLKPRLRPFRWDAPGIAWEPFAHAPSPQLDGGSGWSGSWKGTGFQTVPEPFPTLAASSHLPPTTGHGIIRRSGDKWDPPCRKLGQRISNGVCWMSFRVQVTDLVLTKENWAGMALMDGWEWRWYIGAGQEPDGSLKWYTGPKRKEDEARGVRNLYQPGRDPGLLVLRLAWTGSGLEASNWLNPPPGREPAREQGVPAQGLSSFSFDAISLCGGAGSAFRIADLRLGRTWQEVVPPAGPSSAGQVSAPVAATTASSRKAQAPTIAWEPAADMPGVWRGSGTGWSGNWEGEGLAWHGTSLVPSMAPGFIRAVRPDGTEFKVVRTLQKRIDGGSVWMSFRARAIPAKRTGRQYAGLRFYDQESNKCSIAWNLEGDEPGYWSITPKMRELHNQNDQQVTVPCDPRQVHRVLVKLHLTSDKSAWRLWLDAPPEREPDASQGMGRDGMPAFGFDRIVIWGEKGGGLDLADLRLGRTWTEVLPP